MLAVAARLDGRITVARADAAVDMPVQTLRVYAYESSVRRGDTTTSTSRSWIVRRTGPVPTFGGFAPVIVRSHAGGHAVVATVSQQQVVDAASATYLPLTITTRLGGTRPGTTVAGSTVLHVDALEVDGAPVDVGPACATSSTLAITLVADQGWTDLRGAAGTWDTTAARDCRACGRPPAIP